MDQVAMPGARRELPIIMIHACAADLGAAWRKQLDGLHKLQITSRGTVTCEFQKLLVVHSFLPSVEVLG